jgi:hypothetical protein
VTRVVEAPTSVKMILSPFARRVEVSVMVSVAADRPVMVAVALAVRLVVIAASRPRVLRAVVLSVGFW